MVSSVGDRFTGDSISFCCIILVDDYKHMNLHIRMPAVLGHIVVPFISHNDAAS